MFVTCRLLSYKMFVSAQELAVVAMQIPPTVKDEAQKSYEKEFWPAWQTPVVRCHTQGFDLLKGPM